jgi:hypothetical protein
MTNSEHKQGFLGELKWIAEQSKTIEVALKKVKDQCVIWRKDPLFAPDIPTDQEAVHVAYAAYGIVDSTDPANWEAEFPIMGACELAAPDVIVDELLIDKGIHVWAGMFESYKTIAAIELCAAIGEGRKVFDQFEVKRKHPIIYCCPDMPPALFQDYTRPFGLMGDTNFRWPKPNSEVFHTIDSPVLQKAVEGRVLVLDTMLDYAQIQKAYESGEWIAFFKKLRRLINVCGCVAIIMLVHPTKSGAKSNTIEPSEYLKDSVTFGGKIDVGLAFSKLPDTSQVFVQRIKGRGFKQQQFSFTIAYLDDDGNSNLDRGRFPVYLKPGEAGKKQDHVNNKGGRPKDPDIQRKIDFARTVAGSYTDKANAVNDKFGTNHGRSTVRKWLQAEMFDQDKTEVGHGTNNLNN